MNRMKSILLVSGAVICTQLASLAAFADDSDGAKNADAKNHGRDTTTATSPAPNSKDNYKYDRLMWDHSVPAWSYSELMGNDKPGYCLPRSTVVIGQSATLTTVSTSTPSDTSEESTDNDDPADSPNPPKGAPAPGHHFGGGVGSQVDSPDGGGKAENGNSPKKSKHVEQKNDSVSSSNQYLQVIVDPKHIFGNVFGDKNLEDAKTALSDAEKNSTQLCDGIDNPSPLVEGVPLYVKPEDALRYGWEYGALVVPFKMQLSRKHSFTGSASVGAYLGYSFPIADWGIALSPVLFAGASNISVPTNSGAKDNTQTMAGISYGFGLVTRVKDGFQVGLILGQDHVDSQQQYQFNDKPWISFEIGYSFAQ